MKWVLITAALFILLFIGFGAGVTLYVVNALVPPAASQQEVHIVIPQGTDTPTIARMLEHNGMVRNGTIFTYYLKYHKQGNKFQAGEYAMHPGMALAQIIEMLNNGQTIQKEMIRFTIPEGYTLLQMADKLAEQHVADKAVFLQLAQSKTWDAANVASIPNNSLMKQPLEGYLFPDTYEFKKGSTEHDFIERMLQELDKKLLGLPQDWQQKLKDRGLTVHQMMTVASLIEREVVIDEERPVVAGVIYNRLNKKMNLQIDATVQYLFDKPKDRLFDKDLHIESPYNTYLHPGLPPGPIASPSISSIMAAIYPKETKYLYYVTKKDGSKTHLFAETFQQHQKNIQLSNKAVTQ